MKKTTSVLLALTLTFAFGAKAHAEQRITREPTRTIDVPQDDTIKGHRSAWGSSGGVRWLRQVAPSSSGSDLTTSSPELPAVCIPELFDDFVVKKTVRFIIYDAGTEEDGDVVSVSLNGKIISGGAAVPLTVSGKLLSVTPQAGTNILKIVAISPGFTPDTTVGIQLIRTDLLPGEPYIK